MKTPLPLSRMSPSVASHENVSLLDELHLWHAAGRTASVWLRDDDAVAPTGALDDLIARLRAHDAPCLLAVIPMLAVPALGARLDAEPLLAIAMHGVRHSNHALPGHKKAETPADRGLERIAAEWREARGRIVDLFGEQAGTWYVPPWNRIEPMVAGRLAEVGFRALSTFGNDAPPLPDVMVQRNTYVDIMDWRSGRIGRSAADVLQALAVALAQAREDNWRPVGVLLHHLVHDASAWASLDAVLDVVSAHPATRWCHPDDLLGG